MNKSRLLVAGISLFVSVSIHASPVYLGPTEYLSMSDSPFIGQQGSPFDVSDLDITFFLEDFEDGLLNTPGVTATVSDSVSGTFGPRGPTQISDSVDADDGSIDGIGNAWSYHVDPSTIGDEFILFTFDENALGQYPTHAGVVWTDGQGNTSFEAFDSAGVSLGIIGPVLIADSHVSGETEEDNFFGVINEGGISAIRISNETSGIEADHLQYGSIVPIPAALWLFGSGLLGLVGMARRKA
jgi:hypothetical protein